MNVSSLLFALGIMAFMGIFVTEASAQQAKESNQTVTKAGENASIATSNATFTGTVRLDPLFSATEDVPYSAAYVTFEPGARSFWHTHPVGQRLIVTFGSGLTGTADGKVEAIRVGDIVDCPAGVKHWHGASPTTAMTHMALTPSKDGKNVEWLEEVSNEQYSKR